MRFGRSVVYERSALSLDGLISGAELHFPEDALVDPSVTRKVQLLPCSPRYLRGRSVNQMQLRRHDHFECHVLLVVVG